MVTWRTWAVPACLLIVLLAAGFRNRLQQNCSPRLLLLTALAWRRAGAWCWGPAVLLQLTVCWPRSLTSQLQHLGLLAVKPSKERVLKALAALGASCFLSQQKS